jgi:hypothetical protein
MEGTKGSPGSGRGRVGKVRKVEPVDHDSLPASNSRRTRRPGLNSTGTTPTKYNDGSERERERALSADTSKMEEIYSGRGPSKRPPDSEGELAFYAPRLSTPDHHDTHRYLGRSRWKQSVYAFVRTVVSHLTTVCARCFCATVRRCPAVSPVGAHPGHRRLRRHAYSRDSLSNILRPLGSYIASPVPLDRARLPPAD